MIRWLLLLFLPLSLFAGETGWIVLDGYLGPAMLKQRLEQVEAFRQAPPETVALAINSSSGDLRSAFGLANALYDLRVEEGVEIAVYIQESAVGPAAIFPFLADKLYGARLFTWGDIALGDEEAVPVNVLKSRMRSLIPRGEPHGETLLLLAEAMSDPSLIVVDTPSGWEISDSASGTVVSPAGEALVLDQNQVEELGLLERTVTLEEFRALYPPSREEAAEVEEGGQRGQVEVATPANIDKQLSEYIHYDPAGSNLVGEIWLGSEGINRSTWIYVKSALEKYKKSRPIFIIVHLDTPGGEVLATQQISEGLIDIDKNNGIPCVAFVDNWAISAGAMVAYSCRFIAAAKDAAMGAAEPITMAQGGETQEASEKIKSALRTEYANRAAYYGRNPDLAEAMVDKDVVLVLRHGEIVRLDSDSQIRTGGSDPDVVITKEGKLLTLNAVQMVDFGVADFMVQPAPVLPIAEEERRAGEWPADRSPLFAYPFFAAIPDATIQAQERDWKMKFFSFLANPIVASLLFLGLMLGFYIELNTPGFGAPGIIGLICLFFIILSSFAMAAFNWLELIMVGTGLLLVGLEIFVIPGFGIAGILGIVLTVLGLFAMLLPELHDIHFSWDGGVNWATDAFLERLAWLCGALVVGVIAMFLLTRYVLPKMARFSRFVLHGNEQERGKGFFAGPDVNQLPPVGSKGVALSPLRPAGKVEIGGESYDAISFGGYIATGSEILIARYDGSHMVVEESHK